MSVRCRMVHGMVVTGSWLARRVHAAARRRRARRAKSDTHSIIKRKIVQMIFTLRRRAGGTSLTQVHARLRLRVLRPPRTCAQDQTNKRE